MLDNLRRITKTKFKQRNVKTFSFFLFFAVVIWIFVQFSKQYDQVIHIPVEYVNVPLNKVITQDNPDHLQLRMVENGFTIAWYSLFAPSLEIDVSDLPESEDQLVYVLAENRDDIEQQLDINFSRSEFLRDRLYINYQQRRDKTVPVVPRIEVNFAPGYAAVGPLNIRPDSVTVTGPDNLLDTLNQLQTATLRLNNVKSDLSGEVPIDTSGLGKISFYQNRVNYFLDVEKFTEGSLEIPVELINVPPDRNVVIFPKEILVFYQVNLNDFDDVEAADFRVIADFSEVQENQDFLIPRVAQQPSFVTNVRINEKKIQFVIKR